MLRAVYSCSANLGSERLAGGRGAPGWSAQGAETAGCPPWATLVWAWRGAVGLTMDVEEELMEALLGELNSELFQSTVHILAIRRLCLLIGRRRAPEPP